MTVTQSVRDILQLHARGAAPDVIVRMLRTTEREVTRVITDVAQFNRQRSAALVREFDAAKAAAARVTTTQAAAGPTRVLDRITPARPAPAPAKPVSQPSPSTKDELMSSEQHSLDGLMARAEACDIPRAKQLIAKIRSLAEHLAEVVERQEEVSAARARVDKLKTQLAKETAALKRLTTAPPAGRTQKAKTSEVPAADVPNETLRDFAKEHGLPCNPMGRVPNEVRLAYLAVHGKAKP